MDSKSRQQDGHIRAAIGRPRAVLCVGGSEGTACAEERGARVVREGAGGDDGPFDLVFVSQASSPGALGELLRRVTPRLEDGGHVVVHHRGAMAPGALRSVLRDAGLEPLWHDARRAGGPRVAVARRRPERRPLSLTVGMISMNEAEAVAKVIDAVRTHRPDAEILLVDSSRDDTPGIAEQRGARVIRQFPPRGYGPAMTRLLYAATTDVIVTLDCDGTYPEGRIDDLHRRIEDGADLVNATRTHHRPAAMPLSNYVANRTFAAVAGLLHGFSTTDVHSGMRAYRTSMLRGVYVDERGPALPVELLVVPARRGYRVEDVDIDYFERIGTTTLHRFSSTVWTFRRLARAAWKGGVTLA